MLVSDNDLRQADVLMYHNVRTSPLPSGVSCVEHCGTYISKLELTNNSKKLKPEGFETLLSQRGCFAFRSPPRMDVFLKCNSSVMSVSLHKLGGDGCKQHFYCF
jgi:hypothetical protein